MDVNNYENTLQNASGMGTRFLSNTVLTTTTQRLAAYYTEFARTESANGMPGYAHLDAERAQILSVLAQCGYQQQWPSVTSLVKTIALYLDRQGYWTDRQTVLRMNLTAAQHQSDHHDEGWCANELGMTYLHSGDDDAALGCFEQSLATYQQIGDQRGEGMVLNNLSQIYHNRGTVAKALTALEQSLAIRRAIGDKTGEGATLNNLSQVYYTCGEIQHALTYSVQSLAIFREIGDAVGEATILNNLCAIYDVCGEYAAALPYLERSLAISCELGDKDGEATTLTNLGALYYILDTGIL